MDKKELNRRVSYKLKMNQKYVIEVIDEVFKQIGQELSDGGEFHMNGFGKFSVKDFNQHSYNFQDECTQTKVVKKIKFLPCVALKKAVAEGGDK